MTPKILGFGNVTTLGGTVTLARFDQDGLIEQRIIGSAGGLLEDAFGMTRLFPEPGLARPPRETSFSRMGAVLREQGYYPDGVPGYERQTRLRE